MEWGPSLIPPQALPHEWLLCHRILKGRWGPASNMLSTQLSWAWDGPTRGTGPGEMQLFMQTQGRPNVCLAFTIQAQTQRTND